jgi:hypothetical protein
MFCVTAVKGLLHLNYSEIFYDGKMVARSRNSKIRVIIELPNSEQSYKGKVKTHKYINRQNQSTTGKL